jgi:hypothetical protein
MQFPTKQKAKGKERRQKAKTTTLSFCKPQTPRHTYSTISFLVFDRFPLFKILFSKNVVGILVDEISANARPFAS